MKMKYTYIESKYLNGLLLERCNSIVNALEIHCDYAETHNKQKQLNNFINFICVKSAWWSK